MVASNGLNPVVVQTGLLVRVSNGDVEDQAVVKLGFRSGGEIELREGGIRDGEFDVQREEDDQKRKTDAVKVKVDAYKNQN